jgi:hypothetical protein
MMTGEQLIKIFQSGHAGVHHIGEGRTPEQIVSLWHEYARPADRRRFTLSVRDCGQTVALMSTLRVEQDRRLRSLVVMASVGLLAACWASVLLLDRETKAVGEPAPTCWKWDRGNHTIAIENTLEQFELAHETYRKTGKAPEQLEECSK